MRRKIVVIADCPPEASIEELAQYVQDALTTMGGCRRPPGAYGDHDLGDPLFTSLDVESVTIGSNRFTFEVTNG